MAGEILIWLTAPKAMALASMRPQHNGRGNFGAAVSSVCDDASFNEAPAQWPGKLASGTTEAEEVPALQ